jgi:hypothetical protein
LKRYAQSIRGTIFESKDLISAVDGIYRYPLRQAATDQINRQLKSGIDTHLLADLGVALYLDERLCLIQEDGYVREPQIICLMGLFEHKGMTP